MASGFHGEPRSTHDTDVLVELRREQSKALVRELRPDVYVDEEGLRRALDESSSFNVIHVAGARKFDVFVAGPRADVARRSRAHRSGRATGSRHVGRGHRAAQAGLVPPWRRGERSQWRDVLSVLRVQRGLLDETYLEQMAVELGFADLLARARSAAR